MAMLTIIKFIGFLKVGVLKTIVTTREFAISETTSNKPQATVSTSFCTGTGFRRLWQLPELDPFAVMFIFAAVAVQASSRNTEGGVKTSARFVYSFDPFTLLAKYRTNS